MNSVGDQIFIEKTTEIKELEFRRLENVNDGTPTQHKKYCQLCGCAIINDKCINIYCTCHY